MRSISETDFLTASCRPAGEQTHPVNCVASNLTPNLNISEILTHLFQGTLQYGWRNLLSIYRIIMLDAIEVQEKNNALSNP